MSCSQIRPPTDGRLLGRRRFVQGLAAAGTLAATGLPGRSAWAAVGVPELRGNRFDLTIGDAPVNITGERANATLINNLLPGPALRWRAGDTVTLNVTNRLAEPASIHWHGIRVPPEMDGVPGLSFPGIVPGQTFTYRFPIHPLQHGTYWYHSHSKYQEQTGVYGPLIIDPRDGYADRFDREYVVMLSDWTDVDPGIIVSNLKFQGDFYNFGQRTVSTFFRDVRRDGLGATLADRLMWMRMSMNPADILDVTGHLYTYLLNGQSPGANWTGLFEPGERVRLRFINGSAMSIFDVRIPGLPMSVVAADGNDVVPVTVDEFRISVAETYDVIVTPRESAYTIFAQAMDRSGYARGTLAARPGLAAPVPPMDPRPLRTMVDMGMGGMNMGGGGMQGGMGGMSGMNGMGGMQGGTSGNAPGGRVGVNNQAVAEAPTNRIDEPGLGLGGNGRRVLTYSMLRARLAGADPRPPSREITLRLTGNMERFIWGFDNLKYSQAPAVPLRYGERVRFTLINDSMMDHPIHLHGLWSELENAHGEYRPYKHTVNVAGGETLSYLVTADERGLWAYHCHLLYHMEVGMFRTVVVA